MCNHVIAVVVVVLESQDLQVNSVQTLEQVLRTAQLNVPVICSVPPVAKGPNPVRTKK